MNQNAVSEREKVYSRLSRKLRRSRRWEDALFAFLDGGMDLVKAGEDPHRILEEAARLFGIHAPRIAGMGEMASHLGVAREIASQGGWFTELMVLSGSLAVVEKRFRRVPELCALIQVDLMQLVRDDRESPPTILIPLMERGLALGCRESDQIHRQLFESMQVMLAEMKDKFGGSE